METMSFLLVSITFILYINTIIVSSVSEYIDYECLGGQCPSHTFSRRVIVDWSLLSVGDLILIKSYKGGYLNDNNDETLSTKPEFSEQSMIWEVRYDFPQSGGENEVFQFKNYYSKKYLKIYNGGSTPMCTSKAITGQGTIGTWRKLREIMDAPLFEYQPKYFIMENVAEPTCCRVSTSSDDSIDAKSGCDSLKDAFVFEKLGSEVQFPWGTDDLITLYPNREFVLDWTYVYTGDLVLIKSRRGGYLKDDGDGTLSTDPIFNSQSQLWEVTKFSTWKQSLRNKVTKQYIGTAGKCKSKSVDVVDGKVKWSTTSGGVLYSIGNFWYWQPKYFYMKNVDSSLCCQHNGDLIDTSIEASVNCHTNADDSKWSFERVSAVRYDPENCNSAIFIPPEINLMSELVMMAILMLLLINISCLCYFIKRQYTLKYKSYSKVLSKQYDESSADEKSQFV